MTTIPERPREDDLFFSAVVEASLANPRFLRRDWLAAEVEQRLDDSECRFLLLTAEPGAGKSAFLAQLARDHPAWPRYFIRRDQVAPLGPPGARSLLLHIGFQLAACYPQIFATDRLELTIRQRLGTLGRDASAVGLEVQRLIGSPFRRAALAIIQEVERAEGRVTGLRVGEWVTDPRLIPLDDLQHLALLDPAATLQRAAPDVRLVLLIDALDELRYQDPEGNLLAWLANLPPLPANLRLVLTSRPDDDLLRTLRRKQAEHLRELFLDLDNPEVGAGIQADLTAYAQQLIQSASVAGALATAGQAPEAFVAAAVARAEGNLGYLDALARGIDQALARQDDQALRALLALRELPDEIEGLYAFFLQQIKAGVSRQSVEVEDPASGEVHYLPAWPAVYRRLLGVLAVALAPLTPPQIKAFGGIAADGGYLTEALDRLRQFLDVMDGHYRLYHATVAEFLTATGTREQTHTADLYVDPIRWHRQIAGYYWKRYRDDWQRCDPYGLTNLATHLFESGDADRLAALISKEWMQARYARGSYTYTGFLADVELAWQAVLTRGEEATNLATLVRLHAVRQFVGQAISVYSDTDLQTLVWLGREAEALAHARLRRAPLDQCTGLLAIYNALQAASRPDQALLDEVRNIAGAIQVDHERAEVLHPLAVALAQAGRYAEAEAVAHSIPDADAQAKAVGDLAVVLAQAGRLDQAAALARATADDEERARALREVALAIAQAGEGQAGQMFAEAEQAARSIEHETSQAKALQSLVAALAQMASYGEAHRIAHTIEDVRHQAGALIDLASALAQRGDRRAGQAFTEAEEAAQAAQTVWDRAEALIDLAAALAQAGDGRAGEMFARAEAAAPRRVAFDSLSRAPVLGKLAVALAQAGDPRADRVFAEAQDIARDLEALYEVEWRDWKDQAFRALAADLLKAGRYEKVKDVVGSMQIEAERATVLHDLAKALVQAGRYGEAEEVANSIPIDRARAAALGDLAAALARAGDSQARRVFAEAEAAARSEHNVPRAPTLRHVAMALVQAKHYAAAEAIARAIADPQEQARALYGLVAPFIQAQRYADAEAIAHAIVDNQVQAQALHDLSVSLAEIGRFDEAEALARAIPEREQGWTWSYFEDLIEDRAWVQADRVEAALLIAQHRAEALRSLAAKLAQAGRLDESERVARSIEVEWIRAAALTGLAVALERARDRRASALFSEGEAVARAMRDVRDQARGLRLVATTRAQAGQYDEAEAIIGGLIEAEKKEALRDLAAVLMRANHLEKAGEIAQTIRDRGVQAVVLRDLTVALATAGRYSEAEAVASTIPVDWRREQARHNLAVTMAQVGRFEEAEAAARSIEDQQVRTLALSDLGAGLAQAGSSRAEPAFNDAWELARTRRDLARRAEALRHLASRLAQAGDPRARQAFAEAEESARDLPNDSSRSEALRDLAASLVQAGYFGDALRGVGVPGPDGFVQILALWAPALERLGQGLSMTVLREAIDVAGWVHSGWRRIHELLSTPGAATGK